MLSNCPSLERLAVWKSSFKQKVRVCTQSSKLKSLEFVYCRYEIIEISSPSLIHLRYSGIEEGLQLDYVPLLSELSIGSSYCKHFLRNGARAFIEYFPQLKKLKLDIKSWTTGYTEDYLLGFPELINLEQLEVKLKPDWLTSHLLLIMLIKAAPALQKFSLNWEEADLDPDEDDDLKNLLNVIGQVRHPSLKLIEMLKFSGSSSEMELGWHLIHISPLREQFVVSQFYEGSKKNPRALYDNLIPVEEYRMQVQKVATPNCYIGYIVTLTF